MNVSMEGLVPAPLPSIACARELWSRGQSLPQMQCVHCRYRGGMFTVCPICKTPVRP